MQLRRYSDIAGWKAFLDDIGGSFQRVGLRPTGDAPDSPLASSKRMARRCADHNKSLISLALCVSEDLLVNWIGVLASY